MTARRDDPTPHESLHVFDGQNPLERVHHAITVLTERFDNQEKTNERQEKLNEKLTLKVETQDRVINRFIGGLIVANIILGAVIAFILQWTHK